MGVFGVFTICYDSDPIFKRNEFDLKEAISLEKSYFYNIILGSGRGGVSCAVNSVQVTINKGLYTPEFAFRARLVYSII